VKSLLKILSVGVALLAFSTTVRSAEIYDNEKLLKAVSKGVALDVILDKIRADAQNCHFDSSNDALIAIQDAGKAGGWPADDIKVLQKKVIEIAGLDQKRLKELVDRAQNVWENADPAEYDLMIRQLMKEGKSVVPYVLKQLEQESERKRSGNVDALGRIGDRSGEVVNAINMMLVDRSKPVRLQAAKTIASLANEKTLGDLVARLQNRSEQHHDGAAMALGYLGNPDPKAIEALTRVLHASGSSDARICAAFSLGQLRAKQPAALEALLEAVLDERDEKLRDSAGLSLALIGDKRAVSYIKRAYERYRPGRAEIIKHLSYFKDPEAIEFLIERTDDDATEVKKSANETLRLISGEQNIDGTEEWRAWWEVNKVRPDFRPATAAPSLPDPRGTPKRATENADPINTSLP